MVEDSGYKSYIGETGQAGLPLSAEPQASHRRRSQIRARVEHVFGFHQNSLGGTLIRTIWPARARVTIGLCDLTDNLMRYRPLTKHRRVVPVACAGVPRPARPLPPSEGRRSAFLPHLRPRKSVHRQILMR